MGIPLTFSEALFLILAVWLAYLLILWRRECVRLKQNEWHLTQEQLFHCDHCHHSFVPDEPMNLSRCPRCNAICIRRKRS